MSLDEKQMMDVMALADGELDDDDLARTEKLVEENAEAKELFASLAALGDGVRTAHVAAAPTLGGDIADAVMQKLAPNDLDKARIKRTARTRMIVVGASLVALAAAVLFYMRDANNAAHAPHASSSDSASAQPALASAAATGVQVDFVDTPTPVSVFYLPAETTGGETEGKTEVPATTVVWVDDSMVANPP
jgi:anti-sigma factor RsiW